MDVEIWHNPRCSKSRETMQLLDEAGVEPRVRRYLDDPPSAEELRRVLDLLGRQPWELVRMNEAVAKELGLRQWDRDDPARWIDAMVAHPRLIERPVVVAGDRAVLGRPPSDVQDLL